MKKAGLYFHIPFCKSKCPYCSFYSIRYEEALARDYIDKLISEMEKYDGTFDTVYFGGGTPSCLEPEMICAVLDSAKSHFDIAQDAEITVECNPSKNLERDLELYAKSGVNRISLGMQSAKKEERLALGRVAGKEELMRAITQAKANGITNISLDVMLATPKQTLESLDETFEFIASADVTHISAYMLKIEEGTRFFQLRDKLALPDEDTTCEMYLKTVHALADLGFEQYEISNFCKKGYESRHNNKYWTLDDYLGLGASAHSLWKGERFYYDESFNKISDGVGNTEEERIMLGLRLKQGVEKSLIKRDYSQFISLGLVQEKNDRISLTPEGMLVSNYIISQLL